MKPTFIRSLDGKLLGTRGSQEFSNLLAENETLRRLCDGWRRMYDGRALERQAANFVNETLKREDLSADERRRLRNSKRAVKACLSVMDGLDPRSRLVVARALEATLLIGHYSDPGDAQLGRIGLMFRVLQAGYMRDRGSNNPKYAALDEAIRAERGDGPASNPYKEAAAILSGVNARLEHDGFAPVKVDALGSRLKKFPRS
ncbi:MAG TPA: hypothetical protein VIF40_12910 [Methylosinus sp.]|jgi:hypothetical protein|uniref:hypothetical protein n=1 Tax=Methylosinus sp. TaxID=427 RepID=UPI002F94CA3F